MPTFRITVEKFGGSTAEYWTNIYYASGASVTDFAADITAIVNAEKALYPAWVTITKVRVDDMVPNTDNYVTYARNESGTRTGTTPDIVPLFVTARVDFTTAGGGRPSRKYLRAVWDEGEISTTAVTPAGITRVQAYATAIINTAAIVDVDGQEFTAGTVFPAPQMRQLRRGRKKKATP